MDGSVFTFGSPFKNSVDPRQFYESRVHAEALARLLYLVEEHRRFGLLQGPAGTGKSVVLRVLAARLTRSQSRPVFVEACGLTTGEILWELAAVLRVYPATTDPLPSLFRGIADHLRGSRSAGSGNVLIFDHVDAWDRQCVGLLQRLLHLDPGNTTVIAACANGSIARVSQSLAEWSDLRIETRPLDRQDTHGYVRALLRQAGGSADIFTDEALDALFKHTHGVPRKINRLCDLALLVAQSNGKTLIDGAHIDAALAETVGVSSNVDESPVLVSSP